MSHDSFHPSGYVREEAVKQLARITDGSEIPFLLPRLNDWVPQVRDAAHNAIQMRLHARYAPAFLANAALVVKLRDRELFARVARLVTGSAREELLLASQTGRAAFELLVAAGDERDVLDVALRSHDVAIRRAGARRVMELPRDEMCAPLETLLADSAGSIRRAALTKWIAAFPESANEKLTAALMDPNASVRDLARFQLRIDAKQFYRDAIARESRARRLATAIAGFAETNSDAEPLLPLLSHASARVRRTALRAMVKLARDLYLDRVLDLLRDPAPGVSAQARESLARYGTMLDANALADIFRNAEHLHVRRNALVLFDALPKWDGIEQLANALATAEESEAELVRDLIRRWNARYNKSYTAPSKQQLARLDAALSHVPDERWAKELRFTLQSFR